MNQDLIAKASIHINTPKARVWEALVNPEAIQQYMFGTHVVSDWQVGSPITWQGVWQGKSYEDRGVILQFAPGKTIQYSHFSPLAGLPDEPENYHVVRVDLAENGSGTHVSLTQDNNASEEERAHSEKNWEMMLEALRKYLEK